MNQLLVKYGQNQTAAEKLIHEHKLYAASVHCSYYSCIQLITYVLSYLIPGADAKQFAVDAANTKDSHRKLINKMSSELRAIEAPKNEINTFGSLINQLKSIRVRADYEEYEITERESKKVHEKSIQVIKIIINQFPFES